MVRDFVVLPKGVARRHAEVVVYVRSQYSRPPTEDSHVLCMRGMVEGWRNGVSRASHPELIAHAYDDTSLIQAYRGSVLQKPDDPITYALEVVFDSGDRRYVADPEPDDPALVADLIWDWIEERWDRLNELRWCKTDSSGQTSMVQSLDE
ncbi:hypothetical protein [Nocardia sp. NPDC056000]|uniref:hypothetical protein n=1 Tax=Nocardia sp. NPDC056000 TaxID=3345674 RepID=UPI0035DD6E5B